MTTLLRRGKKSDSELILHFTVNKRGGTDIFTTKQSHSEQTKLIFWRSGVACFTLYRTQETLESVCMHFHVAYEGCDVPLASPMGGQGNARLSEVLLPWPKKPLQPRNSWSWSSVWSCDIVPYRASVWHWCDLRYLCVASSRCSSTSMLHDITWSHCGSWISWLWRFFLPGQYVYSNIFQYCLTLSLLSCLLAG